MEDSGNAEVVTEQEAVTFDDIDAIADTQFESPNEAPVAQEAIEEVAPTETAPVEMVKVVVNGEELEVPRDEVVKNYQAMKASQLKFQEAADLNRETLSIREQLLKEKQNMANLEQAYKNDPVGVLERLGLDPEEFAYKIVNDKIDEEMMTPEQKEAKVVKLRAEKAEAELQKITTAREEHQVNQLKDQYRAKWDREIKEELQSQGVPITGQTIGAVATGIMHNLKTKQEMPVSSIVSAIKPRFVNSMVDFVKGLPPEEFSNLLGTDYLSKIRSNDLKKVKNPIGRRDTRGTNPVKRKVPKKMMSWDDFEASLEDL
jgi:hypothetical protein